MLSFINKIDIFIKELERKCNYNYCNEWETCTEGPMMTDNPSNYFRISDR